MIYIVYILIIFIHSIFSYTLLLLCVLYTNNQKFGVGILFFKINAFNSV